jgi:phosphorylcholine metabolism protein LicD
MANPGTYSFRAKIWIWRSPKKETTAPWHFVTLPKKIRNDIEDLYKGTSSSLGSYRVHVNIGNTAWNTSLFPSKELGLILPLKAAVRKAEDLHEGKSVRIIIEIVV